ncbi:MAG TPA: hypothetical protein VFM18_02595 [Methanosarcina sp.]|nr:hypothetical protein [Methanosarcina sp.]
MTIESFAKIKRQYTVQDQVPAFVAQEHQTFLAFLEAYYEFLSTKQFVTSERLVDYLDADSAPQEFIDSFWEEVKSIPNSIIVDKRLLSKHIKDLYASKGTPRSIQLLFRILYNENISIHEPKEDMLRSSDGKWVNQDIIRTKVPHDFDLTSLNGKKLYQYNDFEIELCQFIVSDVAVVQTDEQYLYVEIAPSSLTGRVFADRLLYNKSRSISLEIIQSFSISSYPIRGSNYKSGDVFFSGLMPCYVEIVGTGPVDDMFIIDPGSGYSIGDYLTIDESGTTGTGLAIVVTSVSGTGGVTGYKILHNGIGYENLPKIVGNGTGVFYPYSSTIGRILKLAVKDPSSENNPINITNRAIVTSTAGLLENERLIRQSYRLRNQNGLGLLTETGDHFLSEAQDPEAIVGTVYQSEDANTLLIRNNFGSGELYSETDEKIIFEDGLTAISSEETTPILDSYTVRSETSGNIFTILYVNQAKINSRLDPIYRVSSQFKNEDGFVSQSTKKIQDSLFYQDFSYVVKSSQSFETYKNILYKLLHPAGTAVFGEVLIDSYVLSVEGRIRKAFDELRVITNSLVNVNLSIETDLKVDIESKSILGVSYDFLEKYKFLLGNNYNTATYGASGNIGISKFNRSSSTGDKNWKISDFSNIRFTDIYSYDPGYYSQTPLTLSGQWSLNGAETLDGTLTPTIENQAGKYRLKRDRRLPWAFGADITQMPTYPIVDILDPISDSVYYSLSINLSEIVTATDSIQSTMSYVSSISETSTPTDSLTGLYTYISQIDESSTTSDSIVTTLNSSSALSSVTTTDQITTVGTDAPKDSTSPTDFVSGIIGTITGINETTINSGPL